jgi:hypothetical protein
MMFSQSTPAVGALTLKGNIRYQLKTPYRLKPSMKQAPRFMALPPWSRNEKKPGAQANRAPRGNAPRDDLAHIIGKYLKSVKFCVTLVPSGVSIGYDLKPV